MTSPPAPRRLVVAMTGASGALYFVRTVRALLLGGHHLDIVISRYGRLTLKEEAGWDTEDLSVWLRNLTGVATGSLNEHGINDQAAPIASGSDVRDAMIIVPCTMKTVAGVAHGFSTNLIERAADVMLKERRKLIVVPREAPFSTIHLQNLLTLSQAGAIVLPAAPAFYQHPQSFDDLGDFMAGRILSLLGLEHDLFAKWQGLKG